MFLYTTLGGITLKISTFKLVRSTIFQETCCFRLTSTSQNNFRHENEIKEIRALLKMSQKHFEEACHEILKELVEL